MEDIPELEPNSIILTDANNCDSEPYEVLIFLTKYRFGTPAQQMDLGLHLVCISNMEARFTHLPLVLNMQTFWVCHAFFWNEEHFRFLNRGLLFLYFPHSFKHAHLFCDIEINSNNALNLLKILWFLLILKAQEHCKNLQNELFLVLWCGFLLLFLCCDLAQK